MSLKRNRFNKTKTRRVKYMYHKTYQAIEIYLADGTRAPNNEHQKADTMSTASQVKSWRSTAGCR